MEGWGFEEGSFEIFLPFDLLWTEYEGFVLSS
jgi:hypothetical protein